MSAATGSISLGLLITGAQATLWDDSHSGINRLLEMLRLADMLDMQPACD